MNDEHEEPIERAIRRAAATLAASITPVGSVGGLDAGGVYVSSLTEAVVGLTNAMHEIADSIREVSDAIRETT